MLPQTDHWFEIRSYWSLRDAEDFTSLTISSFKMSEKKSERLAICYCVALFVVYMTVYLIS